VDSVVTPDAYDAILSEYLHSGSEESLYRASLLSQGCIESGLGPEDIIALHFETLERMLADRSPIARTRANSEAQQFLLEVMIAYGVKYREYLEIRLREGLRDAEARAELERERALNAERLEQERADILATIAHELRTPLTAAMGQLELATRSLTRGQIERLPPILGSARDAMQRLSRLSADLVEVTRGQGLALKLTTQRFDELVAQACTWASAAATANGVRLAWDPAPASIEIVADSDAMLSILGNLLSNAIRYTPSGGQVSVRYGTDGDTAWIAVEDTGIGMTPAVQARIFEKFYRGQEARTLETQGLGLGLALVQQLVQAHGGNIAVQSTPGQGSTFRVALPLQPNIKQEEHHGSAARPLADAE
jgi:signal transduction histidine kinase